MEWKLQTMTFADGTPKGYIRVLAEREIETRRMKLYDMCVELASHSDFKEEKSQIEHYLNNRDHGCTLLLKFHCKLNPIERCWAQAK